MWTVFLDIDGTLMRTQGAGFRAIGSILERRYGVSELPKIPVHGRTDCGIWNNIFASIGIEPPNDFSELIVEYCELLRENLLEKPALILPGVKSLLGSLAEKEDVAVGLLTGNAKQAAEIKMELAGFSTFVDEYGGFGDWDIDRNRVAERAFDAAKCYLGNQFEKKRMWVLGDSDRDVSCAKHIGAKVLAVATGAQTMSELQQHNPDVLVEDFSNNRLIMESCFANDSE